MENVQKIVSRNIKALRNNTKYTQEDIAGFLDLGRSTYTNYENGKKNVPLEVIIKVANYYNVTLDFMCGRNING